MHSLWEHGETGTEGYVGDGFQQCSLGLGRKLRRKPSFEEAMGFRHRFKLSGTKGKQCLGYGYQVG